MRIRLFSNPMKNMRRESLMIAPHVHVCVTSDGSVVLDLKRDRYLGFGKDDTERLATAITAWPRPRWDTAVPDVRSAAVESHAEELLRSLVDEGLLAYGTEVCAHRVGETDSMNRDWISMGDELEVECAVTKRHVANFVAAFVWARGSLALRPFWVVVERTREQKDRNGGDAELTHVLEVAALVGLFRRLRPFVFAAGGRCLLHALTLVRFLSYYGFYPDWVIGVATRPWAAHSWVQWGNFLLDTNPDKVCRYTPIMVV
jgi:hypothetical protein